MNRRRQQALEQAKQYQLQAQEPETSRKDLIFFALLGFIAVSFAVQSFTTIPEQANASEEQGSYKIVPCAVKEAK